MTSITIERYKINSGLRCPKCAASLGNAEVLQIGADRDRLRIDCSQCHESAFQIDLEATPEERE